MSDGWDDEDEDYAQYEKDEKFGEAIAGGYQTGERPVKNKNAKIEQDSCYFCRRTQKEWKSLQSQLIGAMKSSSDDSAKESKERESEIKERLSSFMMAWKKVDKDIKISTLMTDPVRFLPEEIGSYWDEEWVEENYVEDDQHRRIKWKDYYNPHPLEREPEWNSLEFMALRWLERLDSATTHKQVRRGFLPVKVFQDIRVKKIEKKMLKEIEHEFRKRTDRSDSDEEWNRDGDFSKDDMIYVKSRLNDSLTKLLTMHGGLTDFVWKPFSDAQITGVSEKDDSWKSGSVRIPSDSRTDLFSVSMKICPICLDRFRSSDY